MKMSSNLAKYEVLIKQYLRSILDISGGYERKLHSLNGRIVPYSYPLPTSVVDGSSFIGAVIRFLLRQVIIIPI